MRAAKSVLGGDRPRVLFVDDDWKMLSSYRTIVAGQLDAEYVASGEDAFNRILSDSPPQVIVCDVMMPGLSGADIYHLQSLNFCTRSMSAYFISRSPPSACSIPSSI
jgi:CheY-like chemotaxis protein